MSKPASEEALGSLHTLVATVLSERIRGDGCSAADLGAAIKFLKDNEITCLPGGDNEVDALAATLANRKRAVDDATPKELKDALKDIEFTSMRPN